MLRKTQSHGKIGEAATTAKCWMHGIPAYNTAGLRANFAGSDLIIDTDDPTRKLLVQVKTGYSPARDQVYLTQCAGECDLTAEKFVADFVVFVNLDRQAAKSNHITLVHMDSSGTIMAEPFGELECPNLVWTDLARTSMMVPLGSSISRFMSCHVK